MKNSQNITIALLLVTAVVLGALLVGTYNTQTAQAQVSIKQGQFIMASAPYSSSYDLVYILNVAARQLNVYAADLQNHRLELMDKVDLGKAAMATP